MPVDELRRIAILSANRIEYEAVRAHLTNLHQEIHQSGIIYERGNFTANGQSWDVLIGETGIGNTRTAAETATVIEYFKPSPILFVGVAGGLKDVKLGDVVAATKVYGYESGKAGRTFRPRPNVRSSSHRLEQRARAEARRRDWLQRVEEAFPDPASIPHVYVAPIASGNQVAAPTDSALGNLLRSNYSDALAVEMEAYGFLEAVDAYPHLDALIIRGISDRFDDKTEADAKDFQEIAALRAAAFAFEIIAKLDVRAPRQRDQAIEVHEATIVDEFQAPSQEVMTSDLLRGFHSQLSGYASIIEDIYKFLEKRREISPAWCKSVIKRLDTIDNYVQRLRKDAPRLSFYDRVILADIHDQIGALELELQAFRHPRWFSSSPAGGQVVESAYERIRTLCKTLLKDLGSFVSPSPSTLEKSPINISGLEPTVTDSPAEARGEARRSSNAGITDGVTKVSDAIKNNLPRLDSEKQPETELSLYALARAELENDDRALVGEKYKLEAGITRQQLEEAVGEPFRITVQNPAEPLLFQILIHASPNITLLGEWSQTLRYSPLNAEPQFITCPFRLTAAGESYLLVNFYRERQWLKSIRLEFEGVEQVRFPTAARWR